MIRVPERGRDRIQGSSFARCFDALESLLKCIEEWRPRVPGDDDREVGLAEAGTSEMLRVGVNFDGPRKLCGEARNRDQARDDGSHQAELGQECEDILRRQVDALLAAEVRDSRMAMCRTASNAKGCASCDGIRQVTWVQSVRQSCAINLFCIFSTV
jgi:hypothetical protein